MTDSLDRRTCVRLLGTVGVLGIAGCADDSSGEGDDGDDGSDEQADVEDDGNGGVTEVGDQEDDGEAGDGESGDEEEADLEVIVEDEDGESVAGATVWVETTGGQQDESQGNDHQTEGIRQDVDTDDTGQVTLEGLPHGDYRVRAAEGDREGTEEVTIPDDESVTIVLDEEHGELGDLSGGTNARW